ncbi:MAG: HDOD domain-containing protein [Pseudomonadota bacterium]
MPTADTLMTQDAQTFRELGQQIAATDLPAFGATLAEMFRAVDGDDVSVHQMTEIILRDPALTSMVLRAANAAYLGLSGHARVATVSRAVVLLGINTLRSLCVSAMAVESMATANSFRHRVQAALGRALHAAVQARDIGTARGLRRDAAEKQFVSAMLSSVGEMAFWCHGAQFATALDAALQSGMDGESAEKAVLGTTLRQFSRELHRAWKLDGVLVDTQDVDQALQLSRCTQKGWDTPESVRTIKDIAGYLGQAHEVTCKRLQANAEQATLLAAALGAREAAQYIQLPAADAAESAAHPLMAAAEAMPPADEPPAFPDQDPALQLRMLAEMGQVVSSRRELPMLFEACLEGMHRAVGLDRCALCLITPNRTHLVARLTAGLDASELRSRMQWPWTPELEAMLPPQLVRAFSAANPPPRALHESTGTADCLVATLTVDKKVIGLFYADRKPSGRQIAESIVDGFRGFVAQTELIVRGLPRG